MAKPRRKRAEFDSPWKDSLQAYFPAFLAFFFDDPELRSQWKLRIVKGLYKNKWQKEDVRRLFTVIDWLMALPDDIEERFQADLTRLEEERTVKYVTSIERTGIKKGIKTGRRLGRREGIQEGIEKGIEKGSRDTLIDSVLALLNARFGEPSPDIVKRIQAIEALDELRELIPFIAKARLLNEVRNHLR